MQHCTAKKKEQEEETGYWEVTGNLCSNSSLIFWSSAFPLFHVVSVSLANDLVIQASRASSFSKELNKSALPLSLSLSPS